MKSQINELSDHSKQAYETSTSVNGNPDIFDSSLKHILRSITSKQEGQSQEQQNMLQDIDLKIQQSESKRKDILTAVGREQQNISNIEAHIQRKEEEKKERLKRFEAELEKEKKQRAEQKSENRTSVRMSLGYSILFGLTIFLFIFYSSAMHSAYIRDVAAEITQNFSGQNGFTGSDQGSGPVSVNIINLNAIEDAFRKNGVYGLLFALSAPFFFIAIGYLANMSKTWVNTSRGWVKWTLISLPYLIAFLLDLFLAHHIVRDVHLAKYNAGLELTEWTNTLFLQKVDFYLIILTGFVGYIIWGIILDFMLEQKETFSEYRKRREKEEQQRLVVIEEDQKKYESQIQTHNLGIQEKEKQISEVDRQMDGLRERKIEVGKKIPVNYEAIFRLFEECYIGWTKAIYENQDYERPRERIQACTKIKEKLMQEVQTNPSFIGASPNGLRKEHILPVN